MVRYQHGRLSTAATIMLVAALATSLIDSPTVRADGPVNIIRTVAGPAVAIHAACGDDTAASEDLSLQFTSAGHVLRFNSDSVIVASATHMVKMEFVGANRVAPVADRGHAKADGDAAAASLGSVTYEGLWDDITVVYEAANGAVTKSTYYVEDGKMTGSILLHYNRPVALDGEGNLLVAFTNGTMVESAPIAWQEIDGVRNTVDVAFVLHGQDQVGFALGDCAAGVPVVIDPWLTFLGGSSYDWGNAIAVDDDGNVYVSGDSQGSWGSGEGEVNPNPVRAYTSGNDAFAAKLDGDGSLQWNTFLGGSGTDYGRAIAVDGSGNVYVAGYSDATWQGDSGPKREYASLNDAFAAKLDSNGTLVWNTFLGGDGSDDGMAIAVDAYGNVYVGGSSWATWQEGALPPVRPYAERSDAFAAELNSDGVLQWNTFLGGIGNDDAYGVKVDSSGNVYVAGTSGYDWPGDSTTQRPFSSGYDAFAAKLDSDGALQWNAFLGGSGDDYGKALAVDADGNVYVAGDSSATWGDEEGVVDTNPVRPYVSGGDAFAAKMNNTGALQWNTFLGSSSTDYGYGIAVDTDGNAYVSGSSWATWQQGDLEPMRPHDAGSNIDAFAAKLNGNGAVQWNTFLGGSGFDLGCAIAVNDDGVVHLGGYSDAAWGNSLRPHYGSNNDAFAVKLDSDGSLPTDTSAGLEIPLQTGWNLISVPVVPVDASAEAVFPEAVVVYTWDADENAYAEVHAGSATFTDIEPGRAYWVAMTDDDPDFSVTGTPVAVEDWSASLSTGWNMVGTAYSAAPIPLSDLSDGGSGALDDTSIYWWDAENKSYELVLPEEDLVPGRGYWMACSAGCTVTMAPPV